MAINTMELRRVACEVAEDLIGRLREGTLKKIGLPEIEHTLKARRDKPRDARSWQELVSLTCRAVVEKATK